MATLAPTSAGSDLGDSADADVPTGGEAQAGRRPASGGGPGAGGRAVHRWARWLHVYASMIAFLVVLFFGVTGRAGWPC